MQFFKDMTIPDQLFQIIQQQTGLTREQITGKRRQERLVYARRIICLYMKDAGYTTPEIGDAINRDRTNVTHILKTNDDQYRYNNNFRRMFNEISTIYD